MTYLGKQGHQERGVSAYRAPVAVGSRMKKAPVGNVTNSSVLTMTSGHKPYAESTIGSASQM